MRQRSFWARGGGSGLAVLAALVTTLCCLGLPALVGLLSALGAGFLLNDRYLEPLLAATLLRSAGLGPLALSPVYTDDRACSPVPVI